MSMTAEELSRMDQKTVALWGQADRAREHILSAIFMQAHEEITRLYQAELAQEAIENALPDTLPQTTPEAP